MKLLRIAAYMLKKTVRKTSCLLKDRMFESLAAGCLQAGTRVFFNILCCEAPKTRKPAKTGSRVCFVLEPNYCN